MTLFHCKAFGLNIASELLCPELLPGDAGNPEVYILYGRVPTSLENPEAEGLVYQAKPGLFLLKMDNIARYLVSEGTEVVIDRVADSRNDEIRLFLFGSVMGVLLQQ